MVLSTMRMMRKYSDGEKWAASRSIMGVGDMLVSGW
jgi:hypothetical protein